MPLCSLLNKGQDKKNHDKVEKRIHWLLCKCKLYCTDKLHKHSPQSVLEIDNCKIFGILESKLSKPECLL